MGVWGVVIVVLSVMRVVGVVPLWVVCVSSCRCCVFVFIVHPVAILSVVFCVICSLLMFVSDARGDHMVETYSIRVLLWLCMLRGSFPFVSPMLLM